jgi:tetratricopeptide (TPR) repeat protein
MEAAMTHDDVTTLIRQGLAALDEDNTLLALMTFEKAARYQPATATVLSCLGYCLARERRDLERALHLCQEALLLEPVNPLHYLNLGKVYLLARQRRQAVITFQKGLRYGLHLGVVAEIKKMGRRRPPLFSFLCRTHVLNRYWGLLLALIGIR